MNNRPLRIVMMTNTYLPHVGGVAKSVHQFTERLRERGHRVLVTAPEFDGAPQDEIDVIRTPAIQRFNGSDFSVRLPIPMMLTNALDSFNPDVIHSHHPFLMGDTALRSASHRRKPLIFTHHTLYEQYTHYVPGDSPAMRRFAIELGTSYANLCDRVIAPSQSIESILTERGVIAPITVIPTGVDLHEFAEGDGARFRHRLGLEKNHILIGHVGRLAPEKNLEFLARSVAGFIQSTQSAHFAVVGDGPSRGAIENAFHERSISERLHCTGKLSGRDLIDAYAAMDVFAFASLSETQGMVVSEAMAGGAPVVALDAPGVREVVTDGVNGRLLTDENEHAFAEALREVACHREQRVRMSEQAQNSAIGFSMDRCTDRLVELYHAAIDSHKNDGERDDNAWRRAMDGLKTEWNILSRLTGAIVNALQEPEQDENPNWDEINR